jgi:hypothetical protein
MRPFCGKCSRKHIAQAIILLNESKLGYPSHLWLAIGHLAEAEAEIDGKYHEIALKIREERLKVEETGDSENLLGIIIEISKLAKDNNDNCDYWG